MIPFPISEIESINNAISCNKPIEAIIEVKIMMILWNFPDICWFALIIRNHLAKLYRRLMAMRVYGIIASECLIFNASP